MRKFIVGAILALFSVSAFAQTADELWNDLMAGNQLFIEGQVVYGSLRSARAMWATGQNPPVSILSCADSRVPAEIVFQRTVGELFVVRTAGNVEDEFNVASLEYAAGVEKWTKLIVVMGHSECGAIKAALNTWKPGEPTPSLYSLIVRLRYAFTPPIDPKDNLRARTIENICYTAMQLRHWSPTLKDVPIKTAYYDVATGVVTGVPCGGTQKPTSFCRLTPEK
jgi:carbonic anhydrase